MKSAQKIQPYPQHVLKSFAQMCSELSDLNLEAVMGETIVVGGYEAVVYPSPHGFFLMGQGGRYFVRPGQWRNACGDGGYWTTEAAAREFAAKCADQPEPSAAGGLIYLASPYSHEDTAIRDERFNIVCRVAARLMAQGHLIFSPIAHTHPIAMAGELPTGWDFWQKYDHAHLDAAAQVWVLRIDGWDRSTGVKAEIDYAMSKGKPVAYICPTPNDLHPAPATELAELRADNAKLRSGFHAQLAIAAEGVRENAELRAEVERLTKERDAQKHTYDTLLFYARKDRDKWKDGFHQMDGYGNASTTRAERERDALREACKSAENLCELLIADGIGGHTSDAMIPRVMHKLRSALAPTGDADGK